MSDLKTCIIPAAGKGTRWAPISGYLPKEMLPLGDRPVIEWVISEVSSAGLKDIIVVINKQKEIIKDYLFKSKKKIKLNFVYQNQPLGIAHAVMLCQKAIGNHPFGLALPDLPVISRKSAMGQLLGVFRKLNSKAHIVSFNAFPKADLHSYTECLAKERKDELLEVIHFCPKDLHQAHHLNNKIRMSGRYIFSPQIFTAIKNLKKRFGEKEVSDADLLREGLSLNQKIIGVNIEGRTFDTGNPVSYIHANSAYFKQKLF